MSDRTSQSARGRRARATALLGVGTLLAGAGVAGLAPGGATASSHREAPAIAGQSQYDNTDLYAFVDPNHPDQVSLVANWIPFEEPGGGPNFYPWATDAQYDIRIDNDDDAKPDVIYRWKFRDSRTPKASDSFTGNGTFLYTNGPVTSLKDENLLFRQTYDLQRITVRKGPDKVRKVLDNAPVAPSHVGDAAMPDYRSLRDAAVRTYGTSRHSFAGQSEDPFFLDLRVFDLLYGGDCMSEAGHDSLAGFNTNALALQVPRGDLTAKGQDVVGIWSTTSRKNSNGDYKQVSRLGQPLVNEVVIPYQVKDTFNSLKPTQDAAALPFVENSELAATLNAVCGTNAPVKDRDDLVQVFLQGVPGINNPKGAGTPSEMLRLNTRWQDGQTFDRLGVLGGDKNGFPNGRRLQDDVVDIAIQAVAGELKGMPNDLGDGVNSNDSAFSSAFPYVGLPHSGSIEKDAPPAQSPQSLVPGAARGGGPSDGFPAGQLGLSGLGALALVAGAAMARAAARRPATGSTATAATA
jgi:hypothetical protein